MFTCLLVYALFCCLLPPLIAQQNPTVDQFIGVNWQISSSPDGIECAGFVREFSRWVDTQSEGNDPNVAASALYPDECLDLNPAASGNPAYINFNYERFQEMGLTLTASMTSTLPTYSGSSDPIDREKWKPLNWLEDDSDIGVDEDGDGIIDIDQEAILTTPGSYVERADWIYQYVSQFVTDNTAPASTEKICDPEDAGNPTPVFQFVESWNEPNLPFPTAQRAQVQFTPQEYAAMASCDFDGHEGTVLAAESSAMNAPTYPVGVRNASPGVQFVMGAPFDIEYGSPDMDPGTGFGVWELWVQPMFEWFEDNRTDEEFIFDVLNFHHYSVDGPNTFADHWISPEEDLLRPRMAALVETKNTAFSGILADREIWISEFGYDTNQNDGNGWDFDLSGFPAGMDEDFLVEQLQAQWISRSFLEFAAAGIDRAVVHDLNDGAVASNDWDKSTGLHTFGGDPKESWFHVFGMRNILEGYRFVEDESINCDLTSSDTECDTPAATKCTRVYRFENNAGDQIWAVWSPTSCAIDEYSITVDGVGPTAGVLKLGAPSIHGISQSFSSNGNDITLLVDETPSFILQEQVTPPDCPVVTVTDESCSSALLTLDLNQNTFDQFQVWYGTPGTDPLNFSALSGNMEQFIYDADGNSSSILLTGLAPNITYTVAVFPETASGIPIDGLGDPIYCTFNVSTSDNNAIGDICNIPADDILSLTYSGQPVLEERIFDRQNSNLCAGESPGGFEDAWVNFQGNGISQATITFTQNYFIEQLYLFDMGDAGILQFEYLDEDDNWQPFYDYLTNTTFDWKALDESLFNQPAIGVDGLRITTNEYDPTAVGNAIISELFICGRPVCPVGTPTATPTCTDADFILNASGTECAIASELTIQGNSEIETHPVNRNDFNYPSSFFTERGPNQLIPGVTYNPEVETCSGNNCFTETLNFTVPATGSCVLDNESITDKSSRYSGGCGSYTFEVDANASEQVQVWLSHLSPFTSTTTHPLEQNPEAEMMVLTVDEGSTLGGTTKVITVPYDRCERRFYLAYRYITENESSPLFTLTLATAGNNIAWETVCTCTGPNTPTPFFIIEDCHITDVVYDYLEVGEKLSHRELKTASLSTPQTLKQEVKNITSPDYTYHLTYHEVADRLNFKVSAASPWEMLDLTAVPCLRATNASGTAAIENEDINQQKPDLKTSLHLYPNPTRHHLNVEITESVDLLLMGIDGKVHNIIDLKTTNYGYQFSTSHLLPGLYLLRTIDAAGNTQTGKFLVQE